MGQYHKVRSAQLIQLSLKFKPTTPWSTINNDQPLSISTIAFYNERITMFYRKKINLTHMFVYLLCIHNTSLILICFPISFDSFSQSKSANTSSLFIPYSFLDALSRFFKLKSCKAFPIASSLARRSISSSS